MSLKKLLTETERTRLAQPCLRLFASVDLEGSTAFKQAHAHRAQQPWLSVVLDFVEAFDGSFWRFIGVTAREVGADAPPKPRVWKILGDELVFVMELGSGRDAVLYIDALSLALAEWNRDVITRRRVVGGANRPLLAKGAAWLAGFPVTNAVLPVDGNHDDYVGPSMDAGFRVAKLASPRRLALSVELAWLMLKLDRHRKIQFAGRTRELKGVAAESGYPQLWIEVPASDYHAKEHEVLGPLRRSVPSGKLRELCACFLADFGVPPHPPHLPGDPDFPAPVGYDESLQQAQAELTQRYPVTDPKLPTKPKPLPKTGQPVLDALLAALDAVARGALEVRAAVDPAEPAVATKAPKRRK